MAWSYDETSLGTATAAERLNSVRYLVGDTDTNNQIVQNEEITFALSQTGDDIYKAGSYVAKAISAKYSSWVDTELDGALRVEYSQLRDAYNSLAADIEVIGKKYKGSSLGIFFGGVSQAVIDGIRDNDDRVTPAFRMDRFRYKGTDYNRDWVDED